MNILLSFSPSVFAQSPSPALQTKLLTVGNKLFLSNFAVSDGHQLSPLLLAVNATLYVIAGGTY